VGSLPDVDLNSGPGLGSVSGTFVETARTAAGLLTSDAVRTRWDEESSCPGMSVGGLAFHLAAQAGNTVRLVPPVPAAGVEVIEVEEHYRRAAWANTDLDGEANVDIRTSADREAGQGFETLVARVAADLEALPAALAAADHPVLIPWQGWALSPHGWLVTRMMEIVVHSDDLASSVGVETPRFPDEAVRLVLGLLTAVAVERHGQTALVRALSRPQRAPSSVSAF
jgi:hypothetical protein